jgi:SNF2 family DNA or RNA helicase
LDINITENNNEVIVSFPYDEFLIKKAKSIYPYRWNKDDKTWRYPILVREEVYNTFGFDCFPRENKANFYLEEKPSQFLMKHQINGLAIAREYPKYGFFWSTGTGKTIVILEVIKHKKVKSIIVAPLSTLNRVWIDAIKEFYPDMKYVNLYPYNKQDRELIIKKYDGIHIINYEGFKIHYDCIINAGYKLLAIDESSKLKGRTTHIARKLVSFAQKIDCAYLLSGTPAPNTREEFYPQVNAIAPGLLGYNFYSFRSHYFHSLDKNGWIWTENQHTKDDFISRLKKVAWFLDKKDCVDLPEKVFEPREVEMTPEQWRIYKQMKNDFIAEVGDITVISPTVLSKIMKLRQVTSGFLYYQSKGIKFADSKVKILLEELENIGNNQVIIWCTFKEEIHQLLEYLPASRAVYGEVSQTEKDKNIEDFKKGDYKYLIAHPASLGHGQTLTNASYCVYYSLDWSNELFQQSQDRIHRISQTNKCTYIMLLARNTIDEIIYARLQKKIEGSREILEHLKQ